MQARFGHQVGHPPIPAAGNFGGPSSAPYARGTGLPAQHATGAAVYPTLSTAFFQTRFGGINRAVSPRQIVATLVLRGGD
jgi:hypothetical protein